MEQLTLADFGAYANVAEPSAPMADLFRASLRRFVSHYLCTLNTASDSVYRASDFVKQFEFAVMSGLSAGAGGADGGQPAAAALPPNTTKVVGCMLDAFLMLFKDAVEVIDGERRQQRPMRYLWARQLPPPARAPGPNDARQPAAPAPGSPHAAPGKAGLLRRLLPWRNRPRVAPTAAPVAGHHAFVPIRDSAHTICELCEKPFRFLSKGVACQRCRYTCHTQCLPKLMKPCTRTPPDADAGIGNDGAAARAGVPLAGLAMGCSPTETATEAHAASTDATATAGSTSPETGKKRKTETKRHGRDKKQQQRPQAQKATPERTASPRAGRQPAGDTRRALFGVPLAGLCRTDATGRVLVPLFFERCIQAIDRSGLQQVGLYRISPALAEVRAMRRQCEENLDAVSMADAYVHVVTGLLRSWLRELPEPLLTRALYDEFLNCARAPQLDDIAVSVREVALRLPPTNLCVLEMLLLHLARVAREEQCNRMNASSLAVVFGPCLLQSPPSMSPQQALLELGPQKMVVQTLIAMQMAKLDVILSDLDAIGLAIACTQPRESRGDDAAAAEADLQAYADEKTALLAEMRSLEPYHASALVMRARGYRRRRSYVAASDHPPAALASVAPSDSGANTVGVTPSMPVPEPSTAR